MPMSPSPPPLPPPVGPCGDTFDPSSSLSEYRDEGTCGAQGVDDYRADTSSCDDGAILVCATVGGLVPENPDECVSYTGSGQCCVVVIDGCCYLGIYMYECK